MADAVLETDTAIDPHSYGARWAERQTKIAAADQRKHGYQTDLRNEIDAEKAKPAPDLNKIEELGKTLALLEGITYD